jgi:uncharacterized protein involved in response to NO
MPSPVAESVTDTPPGWPVLRAGLRPFYLLSALAATVTVPLWIAVLLWPLSWPAPLAPVYWHAHEMLFGFASATVIGFLLGANRAWTALGLSRASALAWLALLWLAGRLALFAVPYPLYAAIDLALLPVAAYVLVRQMRATGLWRNLPLAAIVLLLALANLVFHLAALQQLDLPPQQPLHAALALLVMLQSVMAGRVIPGFTISATPGLRITPSPALERSCLVATAAGLALWVAAPPEWSWLTAWVLALAAACHGLRQWRWRSRVVWQRPVLWILHMAYLWITLGLALLACAHLGWTGLSAGIHALGVGATGGLIIGMMTRTARAHAGRTRQPGGADTMAYGLVMFAALVRVAQPLAPAQASATMLVVAAAAWSTAFAIYLWTYTPWLIRGRKNE